MHVHGLLSLMVLAQDAAKAPAQKSMTEYLGSAGPLGLMIIGLSIFAVALWIYLLIEIRLPRMAPLDVVETLGKLLREGNIPDAIRYCQHPDNNCFLTRLFGGALQRCSRSQFGTLEMRAALEDSGQRQVERLYRITDWVALIAAVGPMMGLLGTVIGMIGAFGTISALEGAARSHELSGYMSMALVATAMGLIVAIPCTAAFHIFRRRIDRLAEEVADVAERLAAELESRGAAAPRPAPRPVPRPAPTQPSPSAAG